jgi:hypothetical protein
LTQTDRTAKCKVLSSTAGQVAIENRAHGGQRIHCVEALGTNIGGRFSFLRSAQGQFLQQSLNIEKQLPDCERAVIARLENLSHLPPGVWHYHVGDLAHAEDPSVDDSSWPVAKPDSTYPEQALWFRQWVEVPKNLDGYDLTGTRIWFGLKPG